MSAGAPTPPAAPVLGPAELRLATVGAYSVAAVSVAALVQMVSSGTVRAEMHRDLWIIAFTPLPLLACGLAMDFYCVEEPRLRWLARLLLGATGLLVGLTVAAFGGAVSTYLPGAGRMVVAGLVAGAFVLALAAGASHVLARRGPAGRSGSAS